MNEYNKKVMKFDEFINEYNDRIDELNDAKLIIRELKVELRERNLSENTLLSTIEDDVVISTITFKKLSDSSIFTDDKDFTIDD
jgi:propanediol dehydratase large subunit